jgi:predicted transcriptional regulator
MTKSKSKSSALAEKMLTDTELELMTILWRLGEGAVADVLQCLPKGRSLAYTSVSTILRILEQKGVLKARKEGRGHIYVPVTTKSEYEAKTVRHVVSRVFNDAPVALVKQLLDTVPLDSKELDAIRELLKK